jgi:tetratricopeptide (TPR) repeat protein
VDRLRKLRLLNAEDPREPGALDAHPIVRAHFGSRLPHRAPEAFREAHSRLYDFYRYQDLPPDYQNPLAYAALTIVALHPNNRESNRGALADGRDPGGYIPELLHDASAEERKKAAALIGTAAFDEALRKFLPGDLNGMRPCFSAIAHGCAAGRHQEAYSEVYVPRVQRGNEKFIVHKLGALNADLAALASFFEEIWSAPAKGMPEKTKARVLGYAAFALRALGRLREAVEPFEAGFRINTAVRDWNNAARAASNVSELRLTLGDIAEAVAAALTSVSHADTSNNAFLRMGCRTALADALHPAGKAREASELFEEAEARQAKLQPQLPKLYSLQGFQYCDLLLAQGHAQEVIERATRNLQMAIAHEFLLDIALDKLSLGRAYAATSSRPSEARAGIPRGAAAQNDPGSGHRPVRDDESGADGRDDTAGRARKHLDAAVQGLRRAGQEWLLVPGLLARAAFHRAMGAFEAAKTDLDEAQDIAARGEMRLHRTDTHLESARLSLARLPSPPRRGFIQRIFGAAPAEAAPSAETQALRAEAEEHYAAAKKLIDDTGYKRRLPELDAIRACLDGAIPASILDPDRDRNGRPAAAVS